ncbi:hypothetical protein PP639_gp049 [Arthrobacter phage Seahorse]|uniref:Uncharacterized protein n=1 Tax=Arthrobacter phage Seahorse TaxID=2419611 RepID=A0A3G3M4Y0_9CAUD|nr:hypothetical protein PP639_gp049 [Arthrobacter phage Seahorse]AYR01549.1 hypothetical protein PBI_SEAHORSE_49 [Arthrobacter phage Seahorse]
MSTRDELADLIEDAIDDVIYNCADAPPSLTGLVAHHATEAVLAAGYRKSRTITTPEELAALPVGSVVLHNGRAFQHYPAYPAPFDEYQKWKCGDGGFVRSTKDGGSILPAILIHEPKAAE